MAYAIFRSPMSFFETTPSGRILNRFSSDIYRVDEVLARTFNMVGAFLDCSWSMMTDIHRLLVICQCCPCDVHHRRDYVLDTGVLDCYSPSWICLHVLSKVLLEDFPRTQEIG
jgi:ABC-type multidrug transport system fused ATPase/permease subunit